MLVRNFLAKNSTNIIPQAPYSPDLAPCDFFLFSRLKLPLREKRFESTETVKARRLKAPSSAYEKCFEKWVKRWHMCVATWGLFRRGQKFIRLNINLCILFNNSGYFPSEK
jgi:hypothetical protein